MIKYENNIFDMGIDSEPSHAIINTRIMAQLFPKADASEFKADPARVQSLVTACEQDLYHGVMEISYSPMDQTTLFFVDKKVSSVYTLKKEGSVRHPAASYASKLMDTESNVRILSLPLAGVRIGKILIEGLEWGRTFSLRTPDLKVYLNDWQQLTIPTLSHIRWPEAEAVFLIPGNKAPVQTAVFVSREQSLGEEIAVSRAISWPEANCEVTAYSNRRKTEAYEEFWLHFIFIRAIEMILKRYSELSSRRLANNISEILTTLAKENAWNINSMDCQITDDEIFPSFQVAFNAYRKLIGACLPEMEKVIGLRLTNVIFQEAINSINKIDRDILQHYPILSPEKADHD